MAIWNLVRFYHVRDQLLLRLGGLGFLGGIIWLQGDGGRISRCQQSTKWGGGGRMYKIMGQITAIEGGGGGKSWEYYRAF